MRSWKALVGIVAIVSALGIGIALTLPVAVTPRLSSRLVAALGERFDSKVELRALRVSVFPHLRVVGEGVIFRYKGRTDVPPLITIESFAAEAAWLALVGRPLRLSRVRLQQLEINVPPGGMDVRNNDEEKKSQAHETFNSKRGDQDMYVPPPRRAPAPPTKPSPIVVDHLTSERATLRILRREQEKAPRIFEIHHLVMRDTGSTDPWKFTATVTNPKPPGLIEASGMFGPWYADEPALTPLKAEYTFRDADLGVFDEIQGILSSSGSFGGVLEHIEVEGRTSVPAFALSDVGHPMPLETRFHSVVDGTNGNTWLRPVDAVLRDTGIVANGGVLEREGEDGRTVFLDVRIDGRIQDVLRLAVKAKEPPLTGVLKLTTKFVLPPGRQDAMQKLHLDGSFEINGARFTKTSVQATVNTLSEKARGDEQNPASEVLSDFKGQFVMRNGVIRLSSVQFRAPGALVKLGGQFTMRTQVLDLRGTVQLDAKLSEMTSGVKGFFVKLIEPVFRHDNITMIPFKVGGTAAEPKIGLDMGQVLKK